MRFHLFYKNLFLTRKQNWPCAALKFGQSGKFNRRILLKDNFTEDSIKVNKNSNWEFCRNTTLQKTQKVNKNWKFNPRIQLKDNFTENSTKLNESWNFSTKPQKILKIKELRFLDTLSQISSHKLHQNLQHFILSIISFSFLCKKNSFLKLCCLYNLFESISELENCETYCLKLHTKVS